MILVDTSIWIDHIRSPDAALAALVIADSVVHHPFVTVEVALGSLANRQRIIDQLSRLPRSVEIDDGDVLAFIERHALQGKGIGLVDAHLLASAAETADGRLWTRDKRLLAQAKRLELAWEPSVTP